MKPLQITIDGPAGAGKSTIAKALAKRLNIDYVDTGAMYRAITLKALEQALDLTDETAFSFVASTTFHYHDGLLHMDGRPIEEAIRDQTINENVSLVASHLTVRKALVTLQRQLAKHTSVVMDGRDIGTHVLPQAPHKFFLTADVKTRAKRRLSDTIKAGKPQDLAFIEADIIRRDHIDSTRLHNPLRAASDAITIDTSALTIDQVVDRLYGIIREEDSTWK